MIRKVCPYLTGNIPCGKKFRTRIAKRVLCRKHDKSTGNRPNRSIK